MKMMLSGSAMALALYLCASPAAAQESEELLVASSRPSHFGPAGMMGDHVHDKGGLMLGLDVKRIDFGGANRSGTDEISNMEIAAAGYSKRTQAMTMDMVMFHLMYAPDDRLTYAVMPMWMRMDMTMVGIGMPMISGMMPGHGGHHHLAPGETMRHSTEGFGDTEIGALYALSKAPRLGAIAGFMLSVPTGSVDRRNEDGSFVHYEMQSGSGTLDLIPSLTLTGASEHLSWGLQGRAKVRTGGTNDSGYRLGDAVELNGWGAVPLGRRLSVSARLGLSNSGAIKGHYNGPHNHDSLPDRQANYGGTIVDAGLGMNVQMGRGLALGGEVARPLHQDLNGIQAPRRWSASLSLKKTVW